jgi:hypothetical protein
MPRIIASIICLLLLAPMAFADEQVTLQWDPNSPGPDYYSLYQREEGESYNYDRAVPNPPDHMEGEIPHPQVTFTVTVPAPNPSPPAPIISTAVYNKTAETVSLQWAQGVNTESALYYWVVRAALKGDQSYNVINAGADYIETDGAYGAASFIGRILVIESGTGVGQKRRITANTAARIEVSAPFDTIPDSSSTYRIDESSGDSNEVNHTVAGDSSVTRWDVFYSLTSGGPWTLIDSVENTGQSNPTLNSPLTAVPAGERAEVFFTVVAFHSNELYSTNAVETSTIVDRRVLTPPTLTITATINVE